jgi:hypothetical protein
MEDHKDIGILIKNRLEYAEKEELFDFDSEWQAIKPIVKKNNFVTWRANAFNIYYLIFIIASISLLLYYIFLLPKQEPAHNLKKIGEIETSKAKKDNNSRKPVKDKNITSSNHSSIAPYNKSGDLILSASNETKDSVNKNSLNPSIAPFVATDTASSMRVNSELLTSQSSEPQHVPKQNKPVITLNKQDTIIKTDTLRKVKTKKIFK